MVGAGTSGARDEVGGREGCGEDSRSEDWLWVVKAIVKPNDDSAVQLTVRRLKDVVAVEVGSNLRGG